jgi:hypothetical protein
VVDLAQSIQHFYYASEFNRIENEGNDIKEEVSVDNYTVFLIEHSVQDRHGFRVREQRSNFDVQLEPK